MLAQTARPRSARVLAFAAVAIALANAPACAQSRANGQQLYMSICAACHGFPPRGGPDRAAGNAALIEGAINGRVPAMAFLRNLLTAAEIRDIAAWLADPVAGPPPPPVAIVPAHDVTDLWWNAAESGWGLNLIQHESHVVFGVIYTYDERGRPTWLVLPGGGWTNALTYTGPLYRVSGPRFNGVFDPSAVRVVEVGTATLQLADRDTGTFTFSVDGVQVAKPVARQPF